MTIILREYYMHIDASKSIGNNYFYKKLDVEILDKCTAFARQASRLNNRDVSGKVGRQRKKRQYHPYPRKEWLRLPSGRLESREITISTSSALNGSKKYLLETGQKNIFWKHIGGFEYSPCVKALAHCGIVYRGDSREPAIIFREGFKSRNHPDIQCDNDFFRVALESKLEPRIIEFMRETLAADQKNMVCCTKNIDVATYFPNVESNTPTYVYCCYVNSGIKIFETVSYLENPWLETAMAISAQEVMTPIIPPEHVICAWKVCRRKLEDQWRLNFKPEYHELKKNVNVDFCVKEYSKLFPVPEPDKSSKTITIYRNGVVKIDRA